MENFARSDLATECGCQKDGAGIRITETEAGGCEILRVQIKSDDAALRIGKPCGRYVTLGCGCIYELNESEFEAVRRAVAVEIRELAERMTGRKVGSGFSLLVAGLGNREMTPDAIGPETVKHLSVTRHLRRLDTALFSTTGLCEIAAVAPGIPGQTGMDTQEAIRSAATVTAPDLVVAVDALAARSVERLGTTVQISDTGIQPGSGLGQRSTALNSDTVGVPVMAIGVPTVVETATLVQDTLAALGRERDGRELQQLLQNGRRFFVAPKEIDLLVPAAGVLLAGAIEKAFSL